MKDFCPHNKINFIAQNEHQIDSLVDSTEDTAKKKLAKAIACNDVVILKEKKKNVKASKIFEMVRHIVDNEHGQLAIAKSMIGRSVTTMPKVSRTKIRPSLIWAG
jgi:hypothetical protein